MPKAVPPPTTKRAAAQQAPALPPVIEMARMWAGVVDRMSAADKRNIKLAQGVSRHATEGEYEAARAQQSALNELIMVSPIASIEDAAAIAVIAYGYAEGAEGEPTPLEVRTMRGVFARLALLLCEATGLSPDALGGPNAAALMRNAAGLGVAQ